MSLSFQKSCHRKEFNCLHVICWEGSPLCALAWKLSSVLPFSGTKCPAVKIQALHQIQPSEFWGQINHYIYHPDFAKRPLMAVRASDAEIPAVSGQWAVLITSTSGQQLWQPREVNGWVFSPFPSLDCRRGLAMDFSTSTFMRYFYFFFQNLKLPELACILARVLAEKSSFCTGEYLMHRNNAS